MMAVSSAMSQTCVNYTLVLSNIIKPSIQFDQLTRKPLLRRGEQAYYRIGINKLACGRLFPLPTGS